MAKYIITIYFAAFTCCVICTYAKSILNEDNENLYTRSEMGMKVALLDPTPLEISQFEKSIFPSLVKAFEDEKSDIVDITNTMTNTLSKLSSNKIGSKDGIRGLATKLKPNNKTEITNLLLQIMMTDQTDDDRKTKIMEDENDELILPPSVLKQEENMTIPSKRFTSDFVKSKFPKKAVLKALESKKRSTSLPKTLKIRIKVAYDQSFNDLIRSFNYSPEYILKYLTLLLKQIFQLPGLNSTILPEVSSGNNHGLTYNLPTDNLMYIITSQSIF